MGKKHVSDRTKSCRCRKNVFSLLHFLCLFGPLLYFVPYSYVMGETGHKVALSLAVITSIALAFISIIVDVKNRAGFHRSILWLLILGCLFCLQEVKTFILIMSMTSILDELVFVRLKDYYKTALIANKEMDRRNG